MMRFLTISPRSIYDWMFSQGMSDGFMIASHLSSEPGYAVAARALGLTPLLNLGMRLGEGTGCPIAMQVVDDALAVMNRMGTFDGVSLESEYRKGLKA